MEKYISELPLPVVMLLLVVGFAFLIKGADYFVEGSSGIAKKFHVPSIIIGLTIVAMGTSLPETAVSVTASVTGRNSLAISNVVGSNIFNTIVVIGVCAMFTPIAVQAGTIKHDIPFSAFIAVLLAGLGYLGIADSSTMVLGRLDGAILLVLFVGYILVLIKAAFSAMKKGKQVNIEGVSDLEEMRISVPKSLLFIVLGGAAIAVGGDITVDSASVIATSFGMSETLVGLTIVSVGTSLPELVTSMVAAKKGEVDMALGNAIGSNVFNILMILGIASVISPIGVLTENIIDIGILLAFTILVWIVSFTRKKITRPEGIIMVLLYAAYVAYIIMR